MSTITVQYPDPDGCPVPLCLYNDQGRAYLELSEEGVLAASRDFSMDQRHDGRSRAWDVSGYLTIDQIVDLLDEVAPYAQRVHHGHTVGGTLTGDAEAASNLIAQRCERASREPAGVVVRRMWDLGPWDVSSAAGVPDDRLEDWAVTKIEDMAERAGAHVVEWRVVDEVATWIRDQRASDGDRR